MRSLFITGAFIMLFITNVSSQDKKIIRVPLIGDDAPSFIANSTNGKINFPGDFGKNWKIILSHPKDFTPVCSSEILELAQLQEDYEKLGVKLFVLSTDVITQHESWKSALEEIKYKGRNPVKIKFPLIDDSELKISNQYGMIHPSVNIAQNIRAVFIIDPKNKIRSINFYPMEVGRNMDEIKRTVIALQTVDANKNIVTPADWNPGDDVIIPYLSDKEKNIMKTQDSDIYQVSWFMSFKKMK